MKLKEYLEWKHSKKLNGRRKEIMAIPKGKERIAITIHKETKELMNELLSLHDRFSYSNLIEVALMFYAKALETKLNNQTQEKEKN